ncbi:MAG: class I SAM-dependent methyltransferase [Acidimicrobiales bacterium]
MHTEGDPVWSARFCALRRPLSGLLCTQNGGERHRRPAPGYACHDPAMNFIVSAEIEQYAEEHTTPVPAHLQKLAEETEQAMSAPQKMVGALEGRFLEMLVFALQPQRVLEIGMFTGYSSLSMAAALPPGGRIVTCDVDPKAEEIARRHIEASPFADRIEIRMGPALDTIATLEGPFDLVFIDADKPNYRDYYDAVLPKLHERGVIAVDNVLWSGNVVDDSVHDDNTDALRAFNDYVAADPRTVQVMCTIRDGITLVRRA